MNSHQSQDTQPTVRVGIVDSGFLPRQSEWIADAVAFVLEDDALWQTDPSTDQLEHGTRILDVIHQLAPDSEIYMAQVFGERFTTTATQVAAAIDWLAGQGVQVINLSLGLRTDREALRTAVERACEQGILLCASSPARGEPVYPSAYAGVLRITGDARCEQSEWSFLNTRYADFGAHVRCLDGQISGASIGTAYMTGHIAQFMQTQGTFERGPLGRYLKSEACYQGPERRTSGRFDPENPYAKQTPPSDGDASL